MRQSSFSSVLFFVVVIFMLSSCRKDPTFASVLNSPYCACCNIENNPDNLTFGDTSEMFVQNRIDTITFGYYSTDTIFIDTELDGENDFQIISSSGAGMGGGLFWKSAQIQCLTDFAFVNGSLNMDSIYYYQTTTYFGSSPVQKSITNHYKCLPLTCCDSLYSASHELKYYLQNEVITLDQDWFQNSTAFYSTSLYYYTYTSGEVNDTVETHFHSSDETCHNIPNENEVYIGIKKINCGDEKLGWIKFDMNGSEVITEVAIQK